MIVSFLCVQFLQNTGGLICWSKGKSENYAHLSDRFKGNEFEKEIDKLIAESAWKPVDGHPKVVADYYQGKDGLFYAMKVL